MLFNANVFVFLTTKIPYVDYFTELELVDFANT